MTLNALALACNQKTSRRPIVQYSEAIIIAALESLRKKGLVSTATGGTSRSIKYKHNFSLVFPVGPDAFAIICLLLLRGDQTPGELNTNSNRLYEFDSLEEVLTVLDLLTTGDRPMVRQLPRRVGQKEVRYVHLLSGEPDLAAIEQADEIASASVSHTSNHDLEVRVLQLEQELGELKQAFAALMKELNG
jgi:uncharacterized protein YceH (UPF0502 family)